MDVRLDPAYRRCVGMAVFNRAGLVFLGRRRPGPETGRFAQSWQMPQGGIDPGENPVEAARRELYEETDMTSVALLGEAEGWLSYDLPAPLAGRAWKGRYRGQTQKWFAFRFEGDDAEINVSRPGAGKHRPEFSDWRWEQLERVVELIVPFKRSVYEQVVTAFRPFAGP
jgi:putative (di)nucleoside polyphosphate hydrolase